MLETFHMTCPTEDKKVALTVDYIESTSIEDSCNVYIKGLRHSCSGNRFTCGSCSLYDALPDTITG